MDQTDATEERKIIKLDVQSGSRKLNEAVDNKKYFLLFGLLKHSATYLVPS